MIEFLLYLIGMLLFIEVIRDKDEKESLKAAVALAWPLALLLCTLTALIKGKD